jgi:hypothetical protein
VVVQAGDDRPDKHDRQPVSLCYPLLERVRSLLFLVPRATKKCSYPLPLTQRPTAPSVDSLLQSKADMRANLLAYSLSANGVKFFFIFLCQCTKFHVFTGKANSGSIGDSSCNDTIACDLLAAGATVGDSSCNGFNACSGTVGNNSCNGNDACTGATADIGDCEHNTPVPVPACAVPDDNQDGVPNDADACPDTPEDAIVNEDGCAIAQLCPCADQWQNHGQYVSCVSHTAEDFAATRLLTEEEKDAIIATAARSSCGQKK